MPGLGDYHAFLDDLQTELAHIALLTASPSQRSCPRGCSDCCSPLTVLPLEAYALIAHAESAGWGEMGGTPDFERCAFLSHQGSCALYPARPFLCRTRGYPILHLNADGEWERDACQKRGFAAGAQPAGLLLETWNARLFHLNGEFCAQRGIAPDRIRLRDLVPFQNAAMSPTCR